MKFANSPCDSKGSPEDKAVRKKKRAPPGPQLSEFEQMRRDTLGAGDRASYIQGDATQNNELKL